MFADPHVLRDGRRATFLHVSRGEVIIRYRGESHAVAVAASDEPTTRELVARE